MSTKGKTTRKGAATSRDQPGRRDKDGRLIGTPGEVAITIHIKEEGNAWLSEIEGWKRCGEIYARLLEHPRCPAPFREAFRAIFADQILALLPGADFSLCEGDALRVLFPLAVTHLQGWECGKVEGVLDALMTMRDALCPEELVEAVLAEVHGRAGRE